MYFVKNILNKILYYTISVLSLSAAYRCYGWRSPLKLSTLCEQLCNKGKCNNFGTVLDLLDLHLNLYYWILIRHTVSGIQNQA